MNTTEHIAKLKAEYEEALDAQSDADSKVERLEGRLRKLTGCDCTAIGVTCTGHDGRAPYTPAATIGTATILPRKKVTT